MSELPPGKSESLERRQRLRRRRALLLAVGMWVQQTLAIVLYFVLRQEVLIAELLAFAWAFFFPLIFIAMLVAGWSRLSEDLAPFFAGTSTLLVCAVTGGTVSPLLPLFVAVPTGAFSGGGTRRVVRAGVITGVCIALLGLVHAANLLPPSPIPAEQLPWLRFLSAFHAVLLAIQGTLFEAVAHRRTLGSLRRARAEAEASSQAKSRFLAVMSHELRTPLTGVVGTLELLEASKLDEQQRRFSTVMRNSIHSLLGIIDDILDFSKIEAGEVAVVHETFSPSALLEDIAALFAPAAEARGLILRTSAQGLPPAVSGDHVRIRQIVSNLVGNAVKFSDSGTILVASDFDAVGDVLEIRVSDEGIGMSPDESEHIFEPFKQADESTARRYGGTGLGLSISRRLAEVLGGTLDVKSVSGEGSTFTLRIRTPPVSMPVPTPATPVPAADGSSPKLNVLVVDDDPVNRIVLGARLDHLGHSHTAAPDGDVAVEVASRGGYHIVLMDMNMPTVDGPEATRRIRALGGREGSVPIIGLSADAASDQRDRYLDAGLDGYLTKPVTLEALAGALQTTMSPA